MNRAEVAQLVEHSPEKAGVDSSILSLGTTQTIQTITYFNKAAGRHKQPNPSISPSMEAGFYRLSDRVTVILSHPCSQSCASQLTDSFAIVVRLGTVI